MNTYANVPVTSIDAKLPVDWTKLSAETLAHLAWHGLKQKANDPNGAKDLTDDEKLGNSQKVIDSIEKNEVRMSSGRIADPVESEYMKRLVGIVSTAIINKGGKLRDYKMSDLRTRAEEFAKRFPEKAEAIRAKVVSDLQEQAAMAAEV